MAIFPTYQQAIFALDPAAGLNVANQWKDSAPSQLDITPNANFVAPSYGIGNGPSGAPKINFNGTNQCGAMSAAVAARFFTIAPSGPMTAVVVARHNAPAISDRIFSCTTAASTRGFNVSMSTAERLQFASYDAGGLLGQYVVEADNAPLTSRTRVTILGFNGLAFYRWVDRDGRLAVGGGNGNPIAYDNTVLPIVGAHIGGAALFFDGDLYFLGFWPFVFSDQEAKAMSDYWREKT